MTDQFTQSQKDYVYLQWHLLRQANKKAAEHARKWRQLNDSVEEWLDASGYTDPKARADIKGQNVELMGQMSGWRFWTDEAGRILGAMQGEILAVQVLGGNMDTRTDYQRLEEHFARSK